MLSRFLIVAGPPSAGKTSVLLHAIDHLLDEKIAVAACKIDCRWTTADGQRYSRLGIPVAVGASNRLCPDGYYAANLQDVWWWAQRTQADVVVLETAGLCHRCIPSVYGCRNICVVDNRTGLHASTKIAPLLATADLIVLTKSDQVSTFEALRFRRHVETINPWAQIIDVNGIDGTGSRSLVDEILSDRPLEKSCGSTLENPMPAATCTCCAEQTRAGGIASPAPIKRRKLSA